MRFPRPDPAFVVPAIVLLALFAFALVGAVVTGAWMGLWLAGLML